ncbi:hypothetical protein ACA910_014802 [Epithemia clementina (nom. ined.)]
MTTLASACATPRNTASTSSSSVWSNFLPSFFMDTLCKAFLLDNPDRSGHDNGDDALFCWTSAAAFGVSVVLATYSARRSDGGRRGSHWNHDDASSHQQQKQKQKQYPPRHERFSVMYANRNASQGMVGSRGQAALAPPIPYLHHFLACLNDPCDPETNPSGHVALCVAENKLVLDLLAERFLQSNGTGFADSSVYTYNSMLGMPIAREAAAYFLARHFLQLGEPQSSSQQQQQQQPQFTPQQALQQIPPQCLGLGAGCAALINHVFFLLGEPGDVCLIPKPYYAAFENDMNLIAQIEPFGVDQAQPALGPTVKELHAAYQKAPKAPKFLLLTNPNNPLGTIYAPHVIRNAIQWARQHDMHVVMDEIYALSTHSTTAGPADAKFQSVIRLLDNDLGTDVHVLWAVSKDFGASGLRCGLLYTHNHVLMEGLATLSIFTCVSGPIQYLVAELLTDDVYVDFFLAESRRRLRASYDKCVSKLTEMVIPYIPAVAGMFVYADFSSLLPERSFEWERCLSAILYKHARVVLTPGESQRDVNPGMFRICYAWVSPAVLDIAMERLSRTVARLRRMDAQDWTLAAQAVAGNDVSGAADNNDKSSNDLSTRTILRAFAGVLD